VKLAKTEGKGSSCYSKVCNGNSSNSPAAEETLPTKLLRGKREAKMKGKQ